MKPSLLLLLVALPLSLFAQTKDYIVTLQEGEYFSSDNSQIIPNESGYTWEVITEDDRRHYHKYVKGEKRTPAAVDIRIGDFITTGQENGLKYFKVNTTSKKYGPYDGISAYADDKKEILYAYQYVTDGKIYFVDLRNDEAKTYGPFEKGGLWYINEDNLVYSYNEGADLYLMENGKKHGPYDQVSYHVPEIADIDPIIVYKKGKLSYSDAQPYKGVTFHKYAKVSETKNGWLIESGDPNDFRTKWLFTPDGQKLEMSDTLMHVVNFNGDILKGTHVAGRGSHTAFKVSYKDKELGTYALKKTYRQDIVHTDFFNYSLMGVTINSPASSFGKENENYYYSPSKGLLGPLSKEELRHVHFYPGGFASRSDDSTLYLNGKKVLDDVAFATFRDGMDWYAFQQRGDYLYPFKNGKEISVDSLPEKYRYFDTEDKHAIKVQRGNESFIRVKDKGKLLGPIGDYDQFVVSKDGAHYAVVRGRDNYVEVDGKALTKGRNVTYNEQLKAFHWWTIEENKVYVYTYKL